MDLNTIIKAREHLKSTIRHTELLHSAFFSGESGNEVYIKPENLQETGSFKLRGAYNKIYQLHEAGEVNGLVAASAGNHAQGVAYSAKELKVLAHIVMPITTPLIKVEATRQYGVEVILKGHDYQEAYEEAMKLKDEMGYTFIHPFDDLDVIAGQGTIGLEILDELSDVDYVLVPVGGGGLIAGVAAAIKQTNPKIKIIGVEPEGADSMTKSLLAGHVISLDEVQTIAEGVAVRTPGATSFELVQKYVDRMITVTDVDIMEAFLLLLEREKLIAENAGVLSLAALKYLTEDGEKVSNKKIVCVVSGGNIDVVTISELISRGLIVRGRVFCFTVELSDTPGELQKISTLLASCNANIIKLDHNQFKTIDRFKQVILEITVETNGHKHIQEIKDILIANQYKPEIVY